MDRDYNIEDTGALMTQAAQGGKNKKLIMIAAAVAAVVIVALVAGYFVISDKKYEDQIAIATNELSEGNYEQAEAAYLKAVDIKKHKVDAKKGLAFTYAVEGKYEEASSTYLEIYEKTGEEVYKSAAEEAKEERILFTSDIFPSDSIWIECDTEQVPQLEELEEFLNDYITLSMIEYGYDRSDSPLAYDWVFDNEDPGASYALALTPMLKNKKETGQYSVDSNWVTGTDPRGWTEFDSFQRYDKKAIDEFFAEYFNADAEKLDDAIAEAEQRHMMYSDGDHYYEFHLPRGYDPRYVDITDVRISGDRAIVIYDAYYWPTGDDAGIYFGTCCAEMLLKEIDGNLTWTMLYNGNDIPEDMSIYDEY